MASRMSADLWDVSPMNMPLLVEVGHFISPRLRSYPAHLLYQGWLVRERNFLEAVAGPNAF